MSLFVDSIFYSHYFASSLNARINTSRPSWARGVSGYELKGVIDVY